MEMCGVENVMKMCGMWWRVRWRCGECDGDMGSVIEMCGV